MPKVIRHCVTAPQFCIVYINRSLNIVPVQSADQGGLKLLPEQGASSMPGDLSSGESITDRTKTDDAVVFGFGLDQAVPKPLAFSN